MRLPSLLQALHFRISALFLLLLAISAGGYYLWIDATVYNVASAPGEEEWYNDLAAAQLDSLARVLTTDLGARARVEDQLVTYGKGVAKFDAEVSLLNRQGHLVTSSHPDSLSRVLLTVDSSLLESMAMPTWDFNSYPNPHAIDAFENRIFHVSHVRDHQDSRQPSDGYLVASFSPLGIGLADIERDERRLWVQAITVILIAAALSGLILMAWLTRRIRQLSEGIQAFSEGHLDRRIPVHSSDEIGALGRIFNAMADRIATLIQQLRQSDRFHRQLVANISHDLRTPLASMRGYIETLALGEEALPNEERERYLGIIAGNLSHLERLIEHLLQLSRLDSGQAKFLKEEFHLEELIEEILERLSTLAAERGVSLHSVAEGEIPEVVADPLQIGQALQNLVENGIKFNRPEGEVTIHLSHRDGEVEVLVKDTGPGIPEEDLPHVFERFFTGDKSRSHKGESSGLGLAITSMIVAGHDRRLSVDSEVGQGTAFRFTLPAADPALLR